MPHSMQRAGSAPARTVGRPTAPDGRRGGGTEVEIKALLAAAGSGSRAYLSHAPRLRRGLFASDDFRPNCRSTASFGRIDLGPAPLEANHHPRKGDENAVCRLDDQWCAHAVMAAARGTRKRSGRPLPSRVVLGVHDVGGGLMTSLLARHHRATGDDTHPDNTCDE